MSGLLQIEEPPPGKSETNPRPDWNAFLELGFRPLYLAGCLWAALSVTIWVFFPSLLTAAPSGKPLIRLTGVSWHAHEMLWGFVATIAAGFLLTAGSNWTGMNPLKGKALAGLSVVWLLARLAFLWPSELGFALAAGLDIAFFVWCGCALGLSIYRAKNRRNYGIPLLMLGLGATDTLYLHGVATATAHPALMEHFSTGLHCMALLALLISARVIPFFAMRAVPGLSVPVLPKLGHVQLAACLLGLAGSLSGQHHVAAMGLGLAGVIGLTQLAKWQVPATRRVPLMWILHAGFAGLSLGLLSAAAHAWGLTDRAAWPAHIIGVGGFAVLIIGMVTRTALGHLGRPLEPDAIMVSTFALVLAALVLRLLALLLADSAHATVYEFFLYSAALTWTMAFGLYVWRFFPMMIRPRPTHQSPVATVSFQRKQRH